MVYTQSLFNSYLLSGRAPPAGYGSVNSRASTMPRERANELKRRSFAITPAGSAQAITVELTQLMTVEADIILDWIQEFRDTAELAGWDNPTALTCLRITTAKELWPLFKTRKSMQLALDDLAQAAFPPHKRAYYAAQLARISQDHYTLIADYMKALQRATAALAATARFTPEQETSRCEEAFLLGLSGPTLLEMQRLQKSTPS